MNPELRQTLNNLSRNLESANEAAQENIYTFAQRYIDPCLAGVKSCYHSCTASCFPDREEQLRRKRGRPRGRPEVNFDFYDDWDDDEDATNSLMGWGNDELDSLLAGNQRARLGQPRRQRAMSYGSRGRRRANTLPSDQEHDPTVIRGSSYLGFLERLPWNIGSRMLKYKPSAANLQVNPGGVRLRDEEAQIQGTENGSVGNGSTKGHGRQRSDTAASRSTTTSRSSRGDLIFSDGEEDAVPIDDSFAVLLSKRSTNTGSEDRSSGKTGSGKRPGPSTTSTRTISSRSANSLSGMGRASSRKREEPISPAVAEAPEPPTLESLAQEEEQVRLEQEMEVEQKREVAQRLARESGLASPAEFDAEVSLFLIWSPWVKQTLTFARILRGWKSSRLTQMPLQRNYQLPQLRCRKQSLNQLASHPLTRGSLRIKATIRNLWRIRLETQPSDQPFPGYAEAHFAAIVSPDSSIRP